ncbi:Acg family FMN-binding oxidoreductase [Streptomyces chartreusis]
MSVSYESPGSAAHVPPGRAALHLARAATLAPSPHNSQPWLFAEEGHDHGFEVHLHDGRRMILTDPGGREAVIACGAAPFNVRIAVRQLGFRPAVDLLPVSENSRYLAHVGYAAHAPAEPEETLLARAMTGRYTHRGPFESEPVPDTLFDELSEHARVEGATLQVVDEPEQLRLLADLVRTAEDLHRSDPRQAAEIIRSVGAGGVPVEACRRHPDATLLAGRDYLGFARYCPRPGRRWTGSIGTVALLSTLGDSRTEWLRAGQALQRVLLHAAAHDVAAAFHTQPLELPTLRTEIRAHLVGGMFPQVVMRLGRAPRTWRTPRRPAVEVLVHTGAAVRWRR